MKEACDRAIEQVALTPITGISSMAPRHMLAELVQAYEQYSGQPVCIESVGGVDAARRVREGAQLDVVVLAADAIDRLSRVGFIDSGGRVDLARSATAIAVRAGTPHPEIATEAALRETLLAARSIGYSTGPSGAHLLNLFRRLGIVEKLAPRLVQVPPGVPVGRLVAKGEVELGFQQLSELIHLPGIDIVGLLPPGTQQITVFSAAVCAASTRSEDAKALLAFLSSPAAEPAIRRHGMEPIKS